MCENKIKTTKIPFIEAVCDLFKLSKNSSFFVILILKRIKNKSIGTAIKTISAPRENLSFVKFIITHTF